MGKTDIIHMRIEPEIKEEADSILNCLGLTIADAITIFLNQVILNKGLPFEVKLPISNETILKAMYKARSDINLHKFDTADEMFNELGL